MIWLLEREDGTFPSKRKKPPVWGGVSADVVFGGFHPTSPPRVVLRPPCGLPLLLPRLRASESHSESAVGLLGEQGSHEASHRRAKRGGRRATMHALSLGESSQQLLSHLQAERRTVHHHLLHAYSVPVEKTWISTGVWTTKRLLWINLTKRACVRHRTESRHLRLGITVAESVGRKMCLRPMKQLIHVRVPVPQVKRGLVPLLTIPHTQVRDDSTKPTRLGIDDVPVGVMKLVRLVGEPAREAHHVPLSGSAHASQVSQARWSPCLTMWSVRVIPQ